MADHDPKTVNVIDSNDDKLDLSQAPGDSSVEGQDLVKQALPEVDWTKDEEAKAKRKYARRDTFSEA